MEWRYGNRWPPACARRDRAQPSSLSIVAPQYELRRTFRGWRRSADGASAGRWSRGEWRAELRGRGIDGRRPVLRTAPIGLSRPLSLSIVAARATSATARRTTPAVGADPPMGLRLVGGAEVSGGAELRGRGIDGRRPVAHGAIGLSRPLSLSIVAAARTSAAPNNTRTVGATIRRWGFGWSVEPRVKWRAELQG